MVITPETQVSIAVFDAAAGAPVIRRDARTTFIQLSDADRLALAHELTKETAGSSGVLVVVEDGRESSFGALASRYQ
jgi:hypothetical protein